VVAVQELLADALEVEAGHRSGGQSGGPDADDEVRGLEGGVQRGGGLPYRALGEDGVLGLREVREELRQLLVELVVRGEDRDQRGRRRLRPVALGHVPDETLAGLGGADQRDAQGRLVHGGGAVLDQVVDRPYLLVGHRLVGERVGGARLAEEQVLGGGVENERHAGTFLRGYVGPGVRVGSWIC